MVELPFTWPESPRRARATRQAPPPITPLIMRKPWLLFDLMAGRVPSATAEARP